MVKDQLIERVRDKKDSRFVRLALTPIGNEKYELIIKAEAGMYRMLEKMYTKEELQIMNRILRRLLLGTPLDQTLEDRGFE